MESREAYKIREMLLELHKVITTTKLDKAEVEYGLMLRMYNNLNELMDTKIIVGITKTTITYEYTILTPPLTTDGTELKWEIPARVFIPEHLYGKIVNTRAIRWVEQRDANEFAEL